MRTDRTEYENLKTSRIFRNFKKALVLSAWGFVLSLILERDGVTSADTEIMSDVLQESLDQGQYTGVSQYRLLALELIQEVHAPSE